jgi:hypothetical protein
VDFTVKKTDVDSLAGKLDEFGDVLTDNERALLLYTFSLTGKDIAKQTPSGGATGGPAPKSNLPKLSAAFESAFFPGSAGSVAQTESISVSGGGDIHVSIKF